MYKKVFLLVAVSGIAVWGQDRTPGQRSFESRCAICHGGDAHGTDRGPAIYNKLAARNDQSLATVIRKGLPGGMPAFQIPDTELAALTAYLRTLQAPAGGRPFQRPEIHETLTLIDGKTLTGVQVANGFDDHQIRTEDGRIHLLRRVGDKFREVTSSVDWPTFLGDLSFYRYTNMDLIK